MSTPLSDFGIVERHPDGITSITEPNHLWLVNALARAFRPGPIEPTTRATVKLKPSKATKPAPTMWRDSDAA
jgi:hypothetical protein